METLEKAIFQTIDQIKEISLKQISSYGAELLNHGIRLEKSENKREVVMCEGTPTIKIGVSPIRTYLKIELYENIYITNLLFTDARGHCGKIRENIMENKMNMREEKLLEI